MTVEDLGSSGTAAAHQLSKVVLHEPIFDDVGNVIAMISQELLQRMEEEHSLENFEKILRTICKTAVQGSILQLKLCLNIISSICEVFKNLSSSRKSKSFDYMTFELDHYKFEFAILCFFLILKVEHIFEDSYSVNDDIPRDICSISCLFFQVAISSMIRCCWRCLGLVRGWKACQRANQRWMMTLLALLMQPERQYGKSSLLTDLFLLKLI